MEARICGPVASFTDLLLDAVCMVDAAGRFVFVSAACVDIFGYTQEEMVGMAVLDLVLPEDRERTANEALHIMSGRANVGFENRYVRKDGKIVHIMWSARWSEADQLRVAIARDVTSTKRAESTQAALYAISEAAHAAADLPSLYQHMHQIIGRLLPAPGFSVALCEELGGQLGFVYQANACLPAPCDALTGALCAEVKRSGRPLLHTPASLAALPDAVRAPCHWLGVPLQARHACVGVLALHSGAADPPYTAADQELLHFVSTQVATAIQRKQLHTRLRFMAQHDELTTLPNRRLFYDRLATALARAQRHQESFALLYLDLNKFKQVNDRYGHSAGDRLLHEVACRLKDCVREADTVARIGGDEFVVLLEDLQQPEHAALVADKIHQALAPPVELGEDRRLRIHSSIGMALYPEHGQDMHQLIKHADQAMYAAKQLAMITPAEARPAPDPLQATSID